MEKNPLEIQLLYEQKLDNNYFANSNKTTPAMHITSFFSPGKVNILCLSLPQFRGIPQGFAARPEELQNRNLPGSRGCSQVSSKVRKQFTLRKKKKNVLGQLQLNLFHFFLFFIFF